MTEKLDFSNKFDGTQEGTGKRENLQLIGLIYEGEIGGDVEPEENTRLALRFLRGGIRSIRNEKNLRKVKKLD